MVILATEAQAIIDLGQVYKDVRIDNPMGAYTRAINWKAALYPGLTFGDPLCNSSQECPDCIEEAVPQFIDCEKWAEHHTHREVVNQEYDPPSTGLDKSRHSFIYQPLVSEEDHDS